MRGRVVGHFRAHIIGYLALFIALGGTSYAVKKNSVNSRAIKNNAVLSKDIKNRTLAEKDVKPGALGTGAINEDALGKVPAATRADSAGSADTATRADSAASADSATTAQSAASATKADSATTADSATSAGSAATAAIATNATTANNALALDGKAASAYLGVNAVRTFGPVVLNKDGAGSLGRQTLMTIGPFSIVGECLTSGGNKGAYTYLRTSQGGAYESDRGDSFLNDAGATADDLSSTNIAINSDQVVSYALNVNTNSGEDIANYTMSAHRPGAQMLVMGYESVGQPQVGDDKCSFGGVVFGG